MTPRDLVAGLEKVPPLSAVAQWKEDLAQLAKSVDPLELPPRRTDDNQGTHQPTRTAGDA